MVGPTRSRNKLNNNEVIRPTSGGDFYRRWRRFRDIHFNGETCFSEQSVWVGTLFQSKINLFRRDSFLELSMADCIRRLVRHCIHKNRNILTLNTGSVSFHISKVGENAAEILEQQKCLPITYCLPIIFLCAMSVYHIRWESACSWTNLHNFFVTNVPCSNTFFSICSARE